MAANTFDIDDNNEEFCLRWKTFSTTISSEFKTLKDDDDFVDVTIACTGKLLGAHKLVLSACSPYFKHIFKSNPCKHPVLLMLDVDAKQMQSVLQFMYCGEVNVTRNDLPQFLRIASYLQIRGLDEKQKEAAELEAQQQEASTVMPAVPYVNDVPQQSSDEIIVNKEDEVEPVYDNELLEPKVENEFDDVVIEDYDIPEEHVTFNANPVPVSAPEPSVSAPKRRRTSTNTTGSLVSNYVVNTNQELINVNDLIKGLEQFKRKPPDETRFSEFNSVREILEHNKEGKYLMKAIETNSFSERNRKALVRAVVASLINYHGNMYPPNTAKCALAEAIIQEFPTLRDQHAVKGYEHFYDLDTKTGFIEYRLVNLRKRCDPEQKKYKTHQKRRSRSEADVNKAMELIQNINPSTSYTESMQKMNSIKPFEATWTVVSKLMKDTYDHRRNWITNACPCLVDVINFYPRLQDYNGDLIRQDFNAMHPCTSNSFIDKFPGYTKKILAYTKINSNTLYQRSAIIKNSTLRALLLLADLLLIRIQGKFGDAHREKRTKYCDEPGIFDFPSPDLIRLITVGPTCSTFDAQNIPHPLLVLTSNHKVETFTIRADGLNLTNKNPSDPIHAFDLLYKCYYVFNVAYPERLKSFFNFIDRYIFNMPIKPKSSVSSLHINISNCVVDD